VVAPSDDLVRKHVAKPVNPRVIWGAVGGVASFLIVAFLLTVLVKLRTPDGTLVVEIFEEDSVVQVVDSEGTVEIQRKGEKGKLSISVDPGKHRLKVEKDGFKLFTRDFEIESGGEKVIAARLEPTREKRVAVGPKPQAMSSGDDYALEFDGKTSSVHIPTLAYDGSHPITMEAAVNPRTLTSSFIVRTLGCYIKASDARWSGQINLSEPKHLFTFVHDTVQQVGQTVHLAIVFRGHLLHFYINGQECCRYFNVTVDGKIENVDPETPITGELLFVPGWGFYIGGGKVSDNPSENRCFHGLIDEVRISSIARYTEDFTPQRRFEPDEHTMALYHFDEGTGDVLKDSSGNGHDGKIVGAKWVRVDEELGVVARSTDDPDRRAAEWVLGIGGQQLTLSVDGKSREVQAVGELPQKDFHIRRIDLNWNRAVDDASLDNLTGLAGLLSLNIGYTQVTDLGLGKLRGLTSLTALSLNGLNISDSGIESIESLTNLKLLNIGRKGITDVSLETVGRSFDLKTLIVIGAHVSDAGLAHLKTQENLTELNLSGTNVTPAGVADLQAALPNCKIIVDAGNSSAEE